MNKIPVLKIRDENGKFIPINAIRGEKGQDGTNGKSAYEQAKEGGYKGTEQEFIALLNGLIKTDTGNSAHYIDFANPHQVTASQTGAIPASYTPSNDLNTELNQGGNKMTVCSYHSGTLNTPYKEGLTAFAHGMVITNANSYQYGTQLCMPSGEDAIYVRRSNGGGISKWGKIGMNGRLVALEDTINGHLKNAEKHNQASSGGGAVGFQAYADFGGAVGANAKTGGGFAGGNSAQTVDASGNPINAIQLGSGRNSLSYTLQVYDYLMMDEKGKIPTGRLPFASGHYQGTNTYGTSNPNTLTFDFVPKFVIVCQRGERNATGGGCFIWIRGGSTLNFINNGSTYWVHPTLNDKTLSWYCSESASYQLNSSSYTYDYFAWG